MFLESLPRTPAGTHYCVRHWALINVCGIERQPITKIGPVETKLNIHSFMLQLNLGWSNLTHCLTRVRRQQVSRAALLAAVKFLKCVSNMFNNNYDYIAFCRVDGPTNDAQTNIHGRSKNNAGRKGGKPWVHLRYHIEQQMLFKTIDLYSGPPTGGNVNYIPQTNWR